MIKHRAKFAQPEREDITPNLRDFDIILLNTSAGKDSQAMCDYVCRLAEEQGVKDRVVAVHADLGRVEWPGTRELAELQCTVYFNIPLHIVQRKQGNLIDQVRARGMWPDSRNRYCTSDQKRDQVFPLMTRLVNEWREKHGTKRRCRILNCMGLRAQESPARMVMKPLERLDRASNSKREVIKWLPIFRWREEDVWFLINHSGVPYHYAYDLGMPRLSCMFCVFSSQSALIIAGRHNPALLDEYVALEEEIGHQFTHSLSIATIKQRIEAGEIVRVVENWKQ